MNKYLSIFWLLLSGQVLACSLVEQLSTEEMIVQSEAIVIGTVIGFGEEQNENYVLFEIDKKIKGDDSFRIGLGKRIKGSEVAKNLNNRGDVPYQENRRTRPGACASYDYEFGSSYLFFLKEKTPYWAGLKPVNEKITGDQDPWVAWVEGFLAGYHFNKN